MGIEVQDGLEFFCRLVQLIVRFGSSVANAKMRADGIGFLPELLFAAPSRSGSIAGLEQGQGEVCSAPPSV